MIKGKEKVQQTFTKKIGVSEFTIEAVCPSTDKAKELAPYITSDVSYSREDGDGNKQVIITMYLKDITDGSINQAQFWISKSDNYSEKTGKTQYINTIGDTVWANNEEHLKELTSEKNKSDGYRKSVAQFISRPYRIAMPGEAEFYDFLQKFTNIDKRDPDAELSYNFKKFLNEDFTELQKDIKQFSKNTITGVYEITTKKKDEIVDPETGNITPVHTVEYQTMYKRFLPGGWSKYLTGQESMTSYVEKIISKFKEEALGEYGSKGFIKFTPASEYIPAENPLNQSTTLHKDEGELVSSNTQDHIGPDDGLPF